MVVHTIFRFLWVALAFCIAVGIAAAVLLLLGGSWVGDELRALVPDDPMVKNAAPIFGIVLFTWTVAHALTALPALLAIIIGEALRIRSWMYYLLAGGAAVLAIPLLAVAENGAPVVPQGQVLAIFAASGFAGGFIYWLLAGRGA
jgi:hypothetical protein